jgi:transcriptional regulator with XRE-family HTH domain
MRDTIVKHDHRHALKQALYELIVERVDQICVGQGLSREELAQRLGKNRIDVERMLKSPRYWTLEIIADFLNALECDLQLSLIDAQAHINEGNSA